MIYKCEKCGPDHVCLSEDWDSDNIPKNCVHEQNAVWQPTDEYEIIKKPTPGSSANDAGIALKKELLKSKTPNCSICEWLNIEISKNKIYGQINLTLCSAQAWESCSDCYNSENCKSLFKPKQLPSVECEENQSNSETKLMRH